jgi:prepilin-type N-terminal cleavage/methylation domain-containing protein
MLCFSPRLKPSAWAPTSSRRFAAFTLVELLVVIAIIGVLVALLLPAVQAARESARRTQCLNNLKQLALAIHNIHDAKKHLPPGAHFGESVNAWNAATGSRSGTWASDVLPYIEHQAVYDMFSFDFPIGNSRNRNAVQVVINAFVCPSDEIETDVLIGGRIQTGNVNPGRSMGLWYPTSMGPTRDGTTAELSCVFCQQGLGSFCCANTDDYGCGFPLCRGGVGVFDRSSKKHRFKEVTDGLSHTWMIGETIPRHCTYNGAYNNNFPVAGTTIPLNTPVTNEDGVDNFWYTACGFKSAHAGGAHFALADGGVRFIAELIDYQLYNELGSRAGGETVAVP